MPRKKTQGRRIRPRMKLHHRPKRKATGRPTGLPLPTLTKPEGLCDPVIHSGPLPENEQNAKRTNWKATCQTCNRTISGCNRWNLFTTQNCRQAAALTDLAMGNHQLHKVNGHWQCNRCERTCDGAHRAVTAQTRCPIPIVSIGGAAELAGSQWLAAIKRGFEAWRKWRKGMVSPTPPPPAPRTLRGWRMHIPLQQQGQGRRHLVCARCGSHALHLATLQSNPCQQDQHWPKYSKTVLAAGALDASLAALQPEMQAAAIALGWRPPPLAPRGPQHAAPRQPAAAPVGTGEWQPAPACSHPRPATDPGDEPRGKAARLEYLAARRVLKAQDAAPCQRAAAEFALF